MRDAIAPVDRPNVSVVRSDLHSAASELISGSDYDLRLM
jgi:hypothetical protein